MTAGYMPPLKTEMKSLCQWQTAIATQADAAVVQQVSDVVVTGSERSSKCEYGDPSIPCPQAIILSLVPRRSGTLLRIAVQLPLGLREQSREFQYGDAG
mmetsp:Transcript_23907/g.34387  ORF Transcript_23907/g.34387 Transcript_23907/m.34387 type:complete len:99 (+) Transcript_23907:266-562(+)